MNSTTFFTSAGMWFWFSSTSYDTTFTTKTTIFGPANPATATFSTTTTTTTITASHTLPSSP